MVQQSRQLAAIMFTDIVGYTSMMQQNEAKALAVIKHYNSSLEKLAKQFNGQVLNYYGDGSLCIFNSATDAVNCSLAVQKEFKTEPVVPLRIGLHIGEVFFEGDKALGDGVNVASRVQSLGQENTILISGEIQDKIKNNESITTTSLGHFDFKHVEKSMEVFAVTNDGLFVPQRGDLKGKLKSKIFGRHFITAGLAVLLVVFIFLIYKTFQKDDINGIDKSIAVLPFDNLSSDPEQQFFADGVMEDILTQLQRMDELKVTSKTSVEQYRNASKNVTQIGGELKVSYLLEGSVRKSGDEIMITAQLIRASDDRHLWADNFTTTYTTTGLFDIQKQIAESIVRELSLKISPIKMREITQAQTSNREAYEHFQKGRYLYDQYNRTSNELAIEHLKLAIEKDPKYATAYGQLSSAFVQKRLRYENKAYWLDSARVAANHGIAMDSLCAECYKGLAFTLQQEGRPKMALIYYEKAIAINPNFPAALNNARINYFQVGDFKNALLTVQKLGKIDSENFIDNIGTSYLALGNYEEALAYFQKAAELQKDANNLDNLKFSLQHTEDVEKFRETIKIMLVLTGDSVRYHRDWIKSLWRTKQYNEAVTYFETKLKKIENTGSAGLHLTDSYFKIGEIEKSTSFCKEIINGLLSKYDNPELVEENWKIHALASLFSISNNKEAALKWIEKAVDNNYLERSFNEPFFDNLRDEPQFKELVKKQERKRTEAKALMDRYNFPKAKDL